MYYRINHSCNAKIIGNVSQQFETAEYPVPVDHSNFLGNPRFFLKKVDIDVVIPAQPILKRGAKKTDLLVGTIYGAIGRFLISDKLKIILEKENNQGIQFIQTSISYKNEKLVGYWFTNPFEFDYDCIDVVKSDFNLYDVFEYAFKEKLIIANYEELMKLIAGLQPPRMLMIENLFLKESSKDLVILRWVNGGIGYYISEKLKQKIEDAGCTGIEFSNSNERYP